MCMRVVRSVALGLLAGLAIGLTGCKVTNETADVFKPLDGYYDQHVGSIGHTANR